ncbi:MAG: hypothetical protein JWN34_2071 [Bryobacterales bacterium]|jgi:hypothetical protein|nr:hypothetical protein [Bryobacterales bacterium]
MLSGFHDVVSGPVPPHDHAFFACLQRRLIARIKETQLRDATAEDV